MNLSLPANASGGLAWPELIPGKLLKRYKRFLAELENLAEDGHRCMMFYFIQRMDARAFRPADHIDPGYSRGLRRAVKNGIEVLAYDVRIDMQGIELNQNIPYEL